MAANVNTGPILDEFEAVLKTGGEMRRCREAIVILRRWQWDYDLDEESRSRAGGLLREFGRVYGYR